MNESGKNSFKYFENRDCRYYPCHEMPEGEGINCLFCYCPLYSLESCPGNFSFKEKNGRKIKVCTDCTFPHIKDNYKEIIRLLAR